MNEEDRRAARRAAVEQLIQLAGAAVFIVFMDQRARITLKAWWMKAERAVRDWRSGYESGYRVAEWFVAEETPKVLHEAERITREEA